jgi:hypothetical protein
VLLVDGGDCFFGLPTTKAPPRAEELQKLRTARTILDAYNYMGYDAVTLGPGDFQLGVAALVDFFKTAKFAVVCANLVEKGSQKPVFQASTVVEIGGVRVGIYGVTLSSLQKSYRDRVCGDQYDILDAYETSRRVAAALRNDCDVVVALSHLNSDDNLKVLDTIPEVDILVDPFSRSGNKSVWVNEGEYFLLHNKKPLLRVDGQGSRVGILELFFDSSAAKRFSTHRHTDYPLEPQIYNHPDMDLLLKGRLKDLPPGFKPQEGRLFADDFVGEDGCGSCHEKQRQFWKDTKHSRAYASIEKSKDHLRYDCVECHSVAYGVAFADPRKVDRFKDVQCESCHGHNASHAENPKLHRLGAVKEDTCWGCHNELITQIPFNYAEAIKRAACPKMES